MADDQVENFENEGGSVPPAPAAPPASDEQTPNYVSREEFASLQEQNRQLQDSLEGLTQIFAEAPAYQQAPQQGGFDLSQLDMSDPYQVAWLAQQVMQAEMQGVAPYVKNAAQDQGQRQMSELLKGHEAALKNDYPGGFDHKLAERAAFAFFDETGDAEGSVAQAAQYAAEVRKQERDAAVSEYRKKNTRGAAFGDPDASAAGVRAVEPAKSYDEVLSKWVSQSEL